MNIDLRSLRRHLDFRFPALLIAVSAHIFLVGWSLFAQGNPGARNKNKPSPNSLSVSIVPAQHTESATQQASLTTAPDTQHSTSIFNPAAKRQQIDALGDPATPVENANNGTIIYYPAGKLTLMPAPLTRFDNLLALKSDDGIGGKLTIRLWIDDTGGLDRINLINSEVPPEYAEAALAAFRKMRFKPGEIQGIAVKSWVDIVIEYADLKRQAP